MGPIGVFDSGYGGLTVLKEMVKVMPQYNYLYLGDNARTPYGSRSFDVVYNYTLEAVNYLFSQGCSLVILACNTASAKALRTIQQVDLPKIDSSKRVLGVIRPSAEAISTYSNSGSIGVLATEGTVNSKSYIMELENLSPSVKVSQQACPMWVPIVENGEEQSIGADDFISRDLDKLLSQDLDIDTILLGCTHYPLLFDQIRSKIPAHISVISQGEIVADSLLEYLYRHPEIESKIELGADVQFHTTEDIELFSSRAETFWKLPCIAKHVIL